MIANAVRGRPPEPARKLQVCRPAGGAWNSQRSERAARRGGGPLELHPLADGGEVGDAHPGGRAEPVTAGAAAGGTGRRGAGGRGTGHDRFCLSRRGKIAARTLWRCDWCDWSDAPGRTGGVLLARDLRRTARRRSLLSGRAAHRADRRDRIGQEHRLGAAGRTRRRGRRRRPDRPRGGRARHAGAGRRRRGVRRAGAARRTGRWTGRPSPRSSSPTRRPGARWTGSSTRSCAPGPPSSRRPRRRGRSWSTTCPCWWRPARRPPTTSSWSCWPMRRRGWPRLVQRGLTAEDARARIAVQATDEQRRAVADVVLDNSGTPEELAAQVDRVLGRARRAGARMTSRACACGRGRRDPVAAGGRRPARTPRPTR